MDILEQNNFLDLFQGIENNYVDSTSLESGQDSFLDLWNIPDMQGFDHLAGLPLDDDQLELSGFNEEFDVNANLPLPDFGENKEAETTVPDTFSTIKRLWPDHVEVFQSTPIKGKEPIGKKKLSNCTVTKLKLPKPEMPNLETAKMNTSTITSATETKRAMKKKQRSSKLAISDEESNDEIDIETVDDDEMNGKSGAEILSQKLQNLATSGCQAARVREVSYKWKPKKLGESATQKLFESVVAVADLNAVGLDLMKTKNEKESVSPKKVLEVAPITQSTSNPEVSPITASLLQSRRESLLRILPKGARIKPRSKDSSPSSIVEKIKQSSQQPRSSILIPHQEKPMSKSKSSKTGSPTAVVTPFIPPPLTVSESKPTVIPGVINITSDNQKDVKPTISSKPKINKTGPIKSVHIGAIPAPVYKLTNNVGSQGLKLSSVQNGEWTNNSKGLESVALPQVRISSAGGSLGSQQQFVTLTASQTTSLLQNLHKLMPKAVTSNSVEASSFVSSSGTLSLPSSPGRVKVPAELVKTVNELVKCPSLLVKKNLVNNIIKREASPIMNSTAVKQPFCFVNTTTGNAVEPKTTQKVAPFLRESISIKTEPELTNCDVIEIPVNSVEMNSSVIEKKPLSLPSKIDHDYCNSNSSKMVRSSIDTNLTSVVDPWSAHNIESDHIVIDSEGVGEVVTIKSEGCVYESEENNCVAAGAESDDHLKTLGASTTSVQISASSQNSAQPFKFRRDSSSSLASSQRSKRHRSSCSPSNSSSSHSVYCRSRSRSPAGYSKPRRSRSRGRHQRRSNRRYRKYSSSSRSRSRSLSYSRSRSRSWNRNCSNSRSWRSRSRSPSWNRARDYSSHKRKYNKSKNSRSSYPSKERQRPYMADQMKQIEERRVIYVGKIPDGTTKTDLRQRFFQFGDIQEVSIHFRDVGDNYAFVTFAYKSDAYEALEHGNDDASLPKFDLCFGGRRQFCKRQYSDLDSLYNGDDCYPGVAKKPANKEDLDFDTLLRTTRAKIEKKSC